MGPMTNRIRKCKHSEKRGETSYYYQQLYPISFGQTW